MASSARVVIRTLGGTLAAIGYFALVREARLLQRVRQRVDDASRGD